MSKTKVKISGDCIEKGLRGVEGYVDGYTVNNAGIVYACLVLGSIIRSVPIHELEVVPHLAMATESAEEGGISSCDQCPRFVHVEEAEDGYCQRT